MSAVLAQSARNTADNSVISKGRGVVFKACAELERQIYRLTVRSYTRSLRRRLRRPIVKAPPIRRLRTTAGEFGPVGCSHGRQDRISSAYRARRSGVQPLMMPTPF